MDDSAFDTEKKSSRQYDPGEGLIHFYTGFGKGKTTSAIGQAVRFAGSGGRVLFTQFMKDGTSSEIAALKMIPNMEVFSMTEKLGFTFRMSEEERQEAFEKNMAYLREIRKRIEKGDYGMLVLDEAAEAVRKDVLDDKALYDLLINKPKKLEVVVTGHVGVRSVMETADYITVALKMRHPYDDGVPARKGVEY